MRLFFLIPIMLFVFTTHAQEEGTDSDSEESPYFIGYHDQLIGRYYFSRKFTNIRLRDREGNYNLLYEPNSTLNTGLGATYKNITLNLAFGFGLLNPDRGTGESRYLDLQAHIYPKKMVIDFFGQLYDGYYFSQPEGINASDGPYYVLPNMRVRKVGASIQFLGQPERISLRAAFQQNERQIKSGSSPFLGFEIYGGMAANKDGLVPVPLVQEPAQSLQSLRFFEFGPNAGYASTFVFKKYYFITASLSSTLAVGYNEFMIDHSINSSWGLNPNFFARLFGGYNNDRWSLNANIVYAMVNLPQNQGINASILTGNYRLNFIYRFDTGERLQRRLRIIDKLKDEISF
ncbi:DUF4421 domain-containing protein [Pleomorphovibrio marinus]|uniref:DUF4421 domain-containing protein n=1 Tax=Pleomorphovibrio marinus TaxID=2164132 RepID=UPI0013005356|nr:DUF4421 domain-containing protein [Pleomorphovibrio marinus]